MTAGHGGFHSSVVLERPGDDDREMTPRDILRMLLDSLNTGAIPEDVFSAPILIDLGDEELLMTIGGIHTLTVENEDIPTVTHLVLVADRGVSDAILENLSAPRETGV